MSSLLRALMKSDQSAIVEAFISKDLSALSELEEVKGLNESEQGYLGGLRLFTAMDVRPDGYKLFEQIKTHVTEALDKPAPDTNLFVLLLGISTLFAYQTLPRNQVEIFLNRLRAFKSEKLHPDVKAFIHFVECRFELHLRNYQNQLALLETGLTFTKPGKSSWLLLITQRAESAAIAADLATLQRDLDQLKLYKDEPFKWIWPYEILESQHHRLTGDTEKAVRALDSISRENRERVQGILYRTKIEIYLKQNRFAEAQQLFEAAKPYIIEASAGSLFFRRNFTSIDYEALQATEALRKKDLEAAHTHTLRFVSQSKKILPAWRRGWEGYFNFFNIEIAAGRARAARILIQLMDPDGKLAPVEWARVHLLEKNFEKAIDALRQAMALRGAAHVKQNLSYATEISHEILAEILVRICEPSPRASSPKTASVNPSANAVSLTTDFLVGVSPAITDIRSKIEKFAPLRSTVLISGETGTGKDVVARLLHNTSPHSKEPFIAVNCGGLSDNLIESELFGYEKGAFTGANIPHEGLLISAGKGTVFLDEISSMSPHLQASLLRVLEDEQVRPVGSNKSIKMQAKIIAATNESLADMIDQKTFRKDLFYRLGRLHIDIPPLRERREDVPALARHFLKKFLGDLRYEITQEFLDALTARPWPGNVRELRNLIERIVYQSSNSELLTADLIEMDAKPSQPTFVPIPPHATRVTASLRAAESGPSYQGHRHKAILELLRVRSRITRTEVMHELRCSPNTATSDLRMLEEKGLIRRIQPTTNAKSTYFILQD
jgi:DNA-binding NtrC family response regulator/tetratricopeptide (TPR) repeat protein